MAAIFLTAAPGEVLAASFSPISPLASTITNQIMQPLRAEWMGQMKLYAGVGDHDVVIDVTAAIASLPGPVSAVEVHILHDETEELALVEARTPILGAALNTVQPQLYSELTPNIACEDELRTFIKFRHNFAERGNYRLGIYFRYDNNAYRVSTSAALMIGIGDGLYGDLC